MKKEMGRGTLYLGVAQCVFLISGYAINFWLGRYLGPDLYGTFGILFSLLLIYRILVQSGTTNAVSKYTAEDINLAGSIRNQAMKFQIVFVVVLCILLFSMAPLIANVMRDPGLTPYVRLTIFFIPTFALYSVYLGSLNGMKAFGKQAIISIIYHASKVLGVFILVLLGFKIYGAIFGYLIASGIALLLARHYCKFRSIGSEGNFRIGQIISFAAPVILFSAALALVMSLDLFFVRSILHEKAQTGFYTSASILAKTPYYVFFALNLTLFPSIAKATAQKDSEKLIRNYINQSLRYLLILLIPGSFLISATSGELISLVYSESYISAAPALSILIFGLTFLSIFMILTTVINASGRPSVSLMIILVLLVVDVILNRILIPAYQLMGAASATTITGFLGTVMAGTYVYRYFQTLLNATSFLKILFASSVIYLLGQRFEVSGVSLLGYYICLFGLYFFLLFILGEIKKKDFQIAKNILVT